MLAEFTVRHLIVYLNTKQTQEAGITLQWATPNLDKVATKDVVPARLLKLYSYSTR